ncbi:MAG: DUF1700 domain-containing protein [Lachnospiraceae bacterium]|nr:DUF1700 domain-containing protein [Lachnospiraceae bacterium]
MTKQEYMERLHKKLKKLPRESYQEAMQYFEEYFTEAEDEQQAIQNLGTPEEAAAGIIMNLAIENAEEKEKPKSVKRGFSAIWIGILAIFAAPIGLPLALAAAVVLFSGILVIAALWLSLLLTAVVAAAGGVVTIAAGFVLAFSSLFDGIATVGAALILTGVGVLLGYASLWIGCQLYRMALKTAAHMVKGGKNRGKEKED